jgi:hypothetical protein
VAQLVEAVGDLLADDGLAGCEVVCLEGTPAVGEEGELVSVQIPQVRHAILSVAVFLDELFSGLTFGERARGREALRLLAFRQKQAVTLINAETVFFPILMVTSNEAVSLHGTVAVVVLIILVNHVESADVFHVGDGLFDELQKLVLGVSVLARVL